MTGKIRITGGQWRGRKLSVPDLPGLRPTGDRARETLFNWLQSRIRGARCLDLFAGTGALGLEAASRGAAAVTLVEQDRELAGRLGRIAADWPGGELIEVICADALAWLPGAQGPFDLVFVDPPFAGELHLRVLEHLARPGLLDPDARVYLESPARVPSAVPEPGASGRPASSPCMLAEFEPEGDHWTAVRQKTLGEVRMQLLRAACPEPL